MTTYKIMKSSYRYCQNKTLENVDIQVQLVLVCFDKLRIFTQSRSNYSYVDTALETSNIEKLV